MTGIGNVPALAPAASEETSGPGPSVSVECCQAGENAEVQVLFDELHDILGLVALADDFFVRDLFATPSF